MNTIKKRASIWLFSALALTLLLLLVEFQTSVSAFTPPPPDPKPKYDNIDTSEYGNQIIFEHQIVLDIPTTESSNMQDADEGKTPPSETEMLESTPLGWVVMLTEGFEGTFPHDIWTVFDDDGATNGEYYWDDDDYKPNNGSWSAWAANGGADGLDPASSYYANNMKSWMVYGPFSLADADNAYVAFSYWNKSELNFDSFAWYASANGTNWYGHVVSGDSSGWQHVFFDLTNVPTLGDLTGDNSVWLAWVFSSDATNNSYDGPFVDDIDLQRHKIIPDAPCLDHCHGWQISEHCVCRMAGCGRGNLL